MKKILLLSILFVGTMLTAQSNFKLNSTAYVGALSDNAANDWTTGWANWDPKNTNYPAPTDLTTLNGMDASLPTPGEKSLTTTLTLDASKTYELKGLFVVRSGGKLVIPAGTVIRAQSDLNSTPKNYASILVERGGQIEILGTATSPVVMTSKQPVGSRERGDWGGLVISGRAPHNLLNGTTNDNVQMEGFNNVTFDATLARFGGTDPNDNSGIVRYLRIEFGGLAFETNKEINGLTLGGVGAATEINHVQVSHSNDDSFEWFGGNVNSSYLIAWKGTDDDFDTDNGYAGISQFGLGVRDSAYFDGTYLLPSGSSTSEGFESDNEATGTAKVKPYTNAVFSNYTMVGPIPVGSTYSQMNSVTKAAFRRGARIRRNSSQRIVNSFFTGYRNFLMIDGDSSVRNTNWPQALALVTPNTPVDVPTKQLHFTNNLICSTAAAFQSATDTTANGLVEVARAKGCNNIKNALDAWVRQTANPLLANKIDPAPCGTSQLLVNALAASTTPDFRPVPGSPLLSGANFLDNPLLAGITKICAVSASASASNVVCASDANGSATATFVGGAGNLTYLWSNGQTANPATNLGTGTYSVTITDADGCPATASATVAAVDNVAPTVTCPANIQTCNNATAGTLNLSPTVSDNCGGTVNFTKTNNFAANDIYPLGQTVLGFTATDLAGNTAVCSFTVSVVDNAAPVINGPSSIVICEGIAAGTTGLNATATDNCPGTVIIAKTSGWQANDIYPVGQTSLGFVATDGAGNTAQCAFTVTVNPNPVITVDAANNQTVNLTNGSISISIANGPVSSIQWKKDGANFSTNEDLTGLTAGDYVVEVTTAAGCKSTSATITIGVTNCALASTTTVTNVFCPTDATGTATAIPTGDTGGTTYLWSNGQTTATATGLTAGTVSVVITDGIGCTSTAGATIVATDNIAPVVTCPANIAVCDGNAAGTLALTGTAVDNCAGTVGIVKTGTWPGNDLFPLGVTTLGFQATDVVGNTATCAFTVTVNALPVITVGTVTNTIIGQSVGAISITSTSGAGTTYQWKKDGVNFSTQQNLTGLAAGNYQVVVTTAAGCTATSALIKVDAVVAINEVSAASKAVKIQPNPTTDRLFIVSEMENIEAVSVFDLQGRLMISKIGDVREIDLSNLPASQYFVRIRLADGSMANRRAVKL